MTRKISEDQARGTLATGSKTAQDRYRTSLAREIQSAGVLLFGRYYVWVTNPFGKLSLRRTGLGVPGK